MASRARTEGRRADGGAARTDGGAGARGGRPRASISRARARARREGGVVPRRGVRKILAHHARGARGARASARASARAFDGVVNDPTEATRRQRWDAIRYGFG